MHQARAFGFATLVNRFALIESYSVLFRLHSTSYNLSIAP